MRRFVRSIRKGSAPAIQTSSTFVLAALALAASGVGACAAEPIPPVPCPKVEAAPAATGARPELPADTATSFLRAFGAGNPDGGLGVIMSALAGVAAALAVAIMLSVYFRSGYRSRRDLVKHGLAASAVLVLLAFVISDMRNAARILHATRKGVRYSHCSTGWRRK